MLNKIVLVLVIIRGMDMWTFIPWWLIVIGAAASLVRSL